MRTTISLDDKIAEIGQKLAKRDFRDNFSHLCEVALKDYCTPRIADSRNGELEAAAEDLGLDNAIAALKRELRKRKNAA